MKVSIVSSVSSAYYNKKNKAPKFKGLLKESSANRIIDSMSENDKKEFKNLKKRLSKTKFWDMKIFSTGLNSKELKFAFLGKNGNNSVITDGIYPYDRQGDVIKAYSIVYGPENTSFNTIETLRFKSEKRAEELYDAYNQNVLFLRNRAYHVTPLESLKMKEVELKMLEEASEVSDLKDLEKHIHTECITKKTTGNDLEIEKRH